MSRAPCSATKAERISRPISVRIGIDWRLGFVVERRPVAATVWLKVVCRRPSSPIMSGSGCRYVLRSFESSRHSSITATISCSARIVRSTLVSVE